jgi:hypothetical protein
MKTQALPQVAINNTAAIAALEKHIDMLERASRSLSKEQFYYEFCMEPDDIFKLYEELERLKGNATKKVEKPSANKINERRLRAAVRREMMNLLYPHFTKTRILKEFREGFEDISAFERFFDSNYNLLPEYHLAFQDEIYRRITE